MASQIPPNSSSSSFPSQTTHRPGPPVGSKPHMHSTSRHVRPRFLPHLNYFLVAPHLLHDCGVQDHISRSATEAKHKPANHNQCRAPVSDRPNSRAEIYVYSWSQLSTVADFRFHSNAPPYATLIRCLRVWAEILEGMVAGYPDWATVRATSSNVDFNWSNRE